MIRRLFLLLLLIAVAFLAREGWYYLQIRQLIPMGTTVAGVDVGGLNIDEAADEVVETYNQPVLIISDNDTVELNPAEVGFTLDLNTMFQQVVEQQTAQPWYIGYASYVARRPIEPIIVELAAAHNDNELVEVMNIIGGIIEDPPQPPRVDPETLQFLPGNDGYTSDPTSALNDARRALYAIDMRTATIPLTYAEAPPLNLELLESVIAAQVANNGLVTSFYIQDLRTGEEISINGDVAMSGLSMIKIAILLETYRAIDGVPDFDQAKLINETAVISGNFSANLLLDVVAGQDNAYLGSDILTASMEGLGLSNTFIATPYEEPSRPGRETVATPANTRTDITSDPDRSMQTTANDIGRLLGMIYYCANGGGTLLAVYPDTVTPEECRALLDVLSLSTDGNFIRFGVPEGIQVSHKHGFAGNTHGDAGIVFSPNGDYVIIEFFAEPGSDWLVADRSFPVMREVSRITYNFFNYDNPYLNALRAEEEQAAVEAAASSAESAESEPESADNQ